MPETVDLSHMAGEPSEDSYEVPSDELLSTLYNCADSLLLARQDPFFVALASIAIATHIAARLGEGEREALRELSDSAFTHAPGWLDSIKASGGIA